MMSAYNTSTIGTFVHHLSPSATGFHMPAEWTPHKAVWIAWPFATCEWKSNLEGAQNEFIELCKALHNSEEELNILTPNTEETDKLKTKLGNIPANYHVTSYGDIWLRDTSAIFVKRADNAMAAVCFDFNGWGEKYQMPGDTEVSQTIATLSGVRIYRIPMVLEGGAIDVDGEGTLLTTKSCMLSPKRNKELSQKQIEDILASAFGITKTLWITEGLLNDHTDGHIDTIARFIRPGVVACMRAKDQSDPNADRLQRIYSELNQMSDARGRKLQIVEIPSPGKVAYDGDILPASYMNFYISKSVLVPTYSVEADTEALDSIQKLFPDRPVVGVPARYILRGGGALHCITQQQPL